MKELGCTDALNLDGGGSTSIVAQMPGDSSAALMNIPSEGRERNVSTFFYFINQAKKTGTAANLHIYPLMNYVLKGASLQLIVNATDSGFYPCDVPSDVTFSVEDGKNSTVNTKWTVHRKRQRCGHGLRKVGRHYGKYSDNLS